MDFEENIEEIKKLADGGDVESMFKYAEKLYEGKGVEMNKKEAASYYKKASDLGHAKASYEYGRMLYYGRGIVLNKKEASIFKKSSRFRNY